MLLVNSRTGILTFCASTCPSPSLSSGKLTDIANFALDFLRTTWEGEVRGNIRGFGGEQFEVKDGNPGDFNLYLLAMSWKAEW